MYTQCTQWVVSWAPGGWCYWGGEALPCSIAHVPAMIYSRLPTQPSLKAKFHWSPLQVPIKNTLEVPQFAEWATSLASRTSLPRCSGPRGSGSLLPSPQSGPWLFVDWPSERWGKTPCGWPPCEGSALTGVPLPRRVLQRCAGLTHLPAEADAQQDCQQQPGPRAGTRSCHPLPPV